MSRQNKLDIFRKYYLNEIHNFIILRIMLCFSIICIMKLIAPIQTALTELGIVTGVGGITAASLFTYLVSA